jgi:hypothetical protein
MFASRRASRRDVSFYTTGQMCCIRAIVFRCSDRHENNITPIMRRPRATHSKRTALKSWAADYAHQQQRTSPGATASFTQQNHESGNIAARRSSDVVPGEIRQLQHPLINKQKPRSD